MARKASPKAKPQAAAAAPKVTAIRAKMSKAAVLSQIASETGLTRAQVESVMDQLELLINRHIKKRAVGEFSLPGLLKIRSVKRPAMKKRMGRNPKTGEQIEIPAKPAENRVRITPLKRMKEMVL